MVETSKCLLRGESIGALCVVIALAQGLTLAPAAPPVFGNRVFPAAALPESVEAIDLDSDGHKDLVVVTKEAILIYRGDGAGGLTQTQSLVGGDSGLRVADLTGDGVVDLIVGAETDASVSLFRGLGSGVFAPGVALAAGGGPVSVAVADFNDDGFADIATGNLDDQTVSLLFGVGAGAFGPPVAIPATLNTGVGAIAASDIDNDGDMDLLSVGGGFVQIHVNDGAGGFSQSQLLPAGVSPRSIQVGDLNNNGRLDIVVTCVVTNQVLLIQQFAPGQFLPPQTISVGSRPGRLRLVDLDGDGDLDFAVAHESTLIEVSDPNESGNPGAVALVGGEVRVHRNNGSGMFAESDRLYAGAWPRAFGAADFDEDGQIDLVVASRASASSAVPFLTDGPTEQADAPDPIGYIVVALGRGGATFASADRVLSAGASGIKLADLDDDGDPDLIEGRSFGLIVRRNFGDGSFETIPSGVNTTGLPDVSPSFDIGFIDDDARLDIALATSEGVKETFGNGAGFFSPIVTAEMGSFRSVALTDINRDHRTDILAGEQLEGVSDRLVVLRGNGFAGFARVTEVDIPQEPLQIVAVDLNSDGIPDAAVACRSGMQVAVVLFDGRDGVQSTQNIALPGQVSAVRASDLDNDGDPDLVAAVSGPISGAAILLNDGAGGFAFTHMVGAFSAAPDVAVRDFNHDGWSDLFVTNSDEDRIELFLNDRAGGFINAESIVTGDFPRSLAAADIDGDDRVDLVVAGFLPASNDPMTTSFSSIMTHLNIAQGDSTVGDLTGEGVVGGADLALLIGLWGPCPAGELCPADFNADGVVDGADLALLLVNWG